MSVGFGFSVGDFLAALELVGTVIDALRESGNSSASFRALISELYGLESALLRVKRLDLEDNTQALALRQAASQCQRTIDAFWAKVQKYQPHLQCRGTNSRLSDGWAKIKWAVCKQDDLAAFRAEINGHTSSIEILLLTVHIEAATLDARRKDSQYKSLATTIQDFSFQAMDKLRIIMSGITQTVQQGQALLESSAQVIQTNVRVFQMVHDIQLFILRIPGQVQRQQPVYFVDPFNKESPFYLEFIRSAEALLAVLRVNFKDAGCGSEMIDRMEFVIEDLGSQRVIDIASSWDSCFFPGQKVAMSMVFDQPKAVKSTCPICAQEHSQDSGDKITCITCGTVFCRIEDVSDNTSNAKDSKSGEHFDDRAKAPPPPLNVPALRKRKRKHSETSTEIHKFRRLRINQIPQVMRSSESLAHDSPSDTESASVNIDLARTTRFSRPINNDEHWTLYNFETHATLCETCENPLRVSKLGRQLCDEGYELAIKVTDMLIFRRKDGEVYSRVTNGEQGCRIEVPDGYEQTLGLLKAVNRGVRRGEKFPTKRLSHDRSYYVEPREAHRASKPRPTQHESTDESVAVSKRGSLYALDMGELERTEKREQRLRYNVEVREATYKSPRRHHFIYL